jgi:hypothetical protein
MGARIAASGPKSPAVQAPVSPECDNDPAMPGARFLILLAIPNMISMASPPNIHSNCPKNPNDSTAVMPSSINASAMREPPTMKLAASTTGIPAKSNDRIVGPNFHLTIIIPRLTERIMAKKISGNAIIGLINCDMCHEDTKATGSCLFRKSLYGYIQLCLQSSHGDQ